MPKYNDINAITNILNDYSKEIQKGCSEVAVDVAKKGADTLKQTSPKRTGKYRKGWKVYTTNNFNEYESIIYNSTRWQLTHLLEHSHSTRNGGKSKPIVHIKPVEEKCIKEYETEIERFIRNGG